MHDTQLDLEDSKRSRRELQQQLNKISQMNDQSSADCDQMRVQLMPHRELSELTLLQNRNPYIMVLVDGDGMIVSI